mgnify:CR=1 FL=1
MGVCSMFLLLLILLLFYQPCATGQIYDLAQERASCWHSVDTRIPRRAAPGRRAAQLSFGGQTSQATSGRQGGAASVQHKQQTAARHRGSRGGQWATSSDPLTVTTTPKRQLHESCWKDVSVRPFPSFLHQSLDPHWGTMAMQSQVRDLHEETAPHVDFESVRSSEVAGSHISEENYVEILDLLKMES